VDVNAGDYSNSTPLHYACDKNAGKDARRSIPVVQMLLENGANPSLPNRDGLTPLGLAKKKKSTEIEAAIQDFLRQKSAKDHR
jgi:ankyrin repeat protein